MAVRICFNIQQSLEKVFSTVSNPTNLPYYDDNIIEVKPATQTEISAGTTYQLVAVQFGKRLVVNLEIISYEPYLDFAYLVFGGPFPVETHYSLLSQENNTKILARREPQPKGFWKVLMPIMSIPARKKFADELNNLKNYLESN
jgi:hypothetical protein